jgi:Flp pilus assembly protein TadB
MADVYEPELPSGTGAGRARERAPEPEASLTGRSAVDIIKDIVGNIQEIIRSELRLAKAEMTQKISEGSRAGILMAAGAVIGLYALAFFLVCIYNALSIVIWPWLSALIIGFVLGVTAFCVLGVGYSRFRKLNPKPEQTVAAVKEDVQWLKNQMK